MDPVGMHLAEDVARLASTAERVGFDGVYVTDHPIPHPTWQKYGGHHTFDPFVLLAFAAAATSTLRVQTHLVVLPYRNPFLTAKAAASLDALSNGRLILGVGTGYMEQEFAALGVPFERRNEIMDEALTAMRLAWTGEPFELEGTGYTVEGNDAYPRPTQRPGPPVWVGGNAKRAIRRAVELGDGWIPFPHRPEEGGAHSSRLANLDELADHISYAREHAERIGRERPLDIVFMPGYLGYLDRRQPGFDEIVENCSRMAELGVTYLMASVGGLDVAAREEALAAYAEAVLPTVRSLSPDIRCNHGPHVQARRDTKGSTEVPSKKWGFMSRRKRAGFSKVKAANSGSVIHP
ncbi:MAG: LLM class F420-dependent oxidoreductase [Acidimicrobiales bacterium]|nr:LLM class F420-dependent oxidoreductase [Acidimicrobiales bacterium]